MSSSTGLWGNYLRLLVDVSVECRKTSDSPASAARPANFAIDPGPSVFRAQILNVRSSVAWRRRSGTMDAIAVAWTISFIRSDFVTAPAESVLQALEGVGDQLTVSVATYTNIAGVVLGSVGKLLAVFPDLVIGLVTYNLVLDLVYLLLRGGL